jgi:acetylornithine/succinyldiaminopimelate/putrescine aminotransferase
MILEQRLWERAENLGNILVSELRAAKLPPVREIRGKGLMIGIELKQKSAPYLSKLVEKGLLALPAGVNVIRLLPPLVMTEEELRQGISILKEVLGSDLTS